MKKCKHGYTLHSENEIPHERTMHKLTVCPQCAVSSSLEQLGSGIVLTNDLAVDLKEKLHLIHLRKLEINS